jgi:hypothetical protein
MKKQIIIGIIVFAGGLLSPQITQAQGTTYISNLGQSSTNSAAVGSDSWLAMSFATGTNTGGYQLNSIGLGMANATGNPSGFTVMLYSAIFEGDEAYLGSSLGALNGSLNPVVGGVFPYTPTSNLTLSPNTVFFIVLTAGTAIANGVYEWANTSEAPLTYNPIGGWFAPIGVVRIDDYQSSNGSSWSVFPNFPEFAINANALPAVPEPGIYALLSLGGLCFLGLRKRVIRAQSSNEHSSGRRDCVSVNETHQN